MASPPSDPAEAALGHGALVAFSRALTGWGSRGALEESGGVVLCAGGSWIPMVGNSAFRADATLPAAELVRRADEFFGSLGRGYGIKVRDTGQDDDLAAACTAAGLEPFGDGAPQMVLPERLPAAPAVDGVDLRPVDDGDGVRAFAAVNGAAYATYGMPAETVADLFDLPDRVLHDPAAQMVVASRGGEPVATAMVYTSEGVATVQWVGTVPGARGLGLGALVTTAVTNLAFDGGATSCTLEASPMGEPVYRALGYETAYRYRELVRWPAR
jgi:hypothetical protein